jgi:hypothetical protein
VGTMLVIFSFLFSFAHADIKQLEPHIHSLMSGEGDVAKARTTLNANEDLDVILAQALGKGGRDESLALEAIRLLPRLSLVDNLLKKISGMDPKDRMAQARFVALASMVETTEGDNILQGLQKEVSLSAKFPTPLRIALLSAMSLKNSSPSVKVLQELMEESSYELRMKAMAVAESGIKQDPKAYEDFLKKALSVSPYTVRIQAVDYITRLPLEEKGKFRKEIRHCSGHDTHPEVKKLCNDLSLTL